MTTIATRNEPAVRDVLGIPKNQIVASIVALGYPASRATKFERRRRGSIHHDRRLRRPVVHLDGLVAEDLVRVFAEATRTASDRWARAIDRPAACASSSHLRPAWTSARRSLRQGSVPGAKAPATSRIGACGTPERSSISSHSSVDFATKIRLSSSRSWSRSRTRDALVAPRTRGQDWRHRARRPTARTARRSRPREV